MTIMSVTKMTMTVTVSVCMTTMSVSNIYDDYDCVCTTMMSVTKMTMTMTV